MCDRNLPINTKKNPILILVRKNSGLKVLTEAFSNRHGVFVHVDPLDDMYGEKEDPRIVESLLYKLDNLSRCLVDPDKFDAFKKSIRKTVFENDFVRRACDVGGGESGANVDGVCVTSPSSLLSRLCEKFPTRVATSSTLPLRLVRQLMVANPSLNVLYMFRDPRAVIYTRSHKVANLDFDVQSEQLCETIQVTEET